jgi:hypothetical protein
MSNRNTLERVPKYDGHALKGYCSHNPACTRIRESGDHVIAEGPRGSVVFPDRDMGNGLWFSVIKSLVKVGLGLFLLWVVITLLGAMI